MDILWDVALLGGLLILLLGLSKWSRRENSKLRAKGRTSNDSYDALDNREYGKALNFGDQPKGITVLGYVLCGLVLLFFVVLASWVVYKLW